MGELCKDEGVIVLERLPHDEFARSTSSILKGSLEKAIEGRVVQRLTISERCVLHIMESHIEENRGFFESSCEQLGVTATNYHSRIIEVLEGTYADGKINWGRILTTLCFCRCIGLYSQRIGLPSSALESVVSWATIFICDRLKDWIMNEGGWVRKCHCRRNYENCYRSSLLW